MSTGSNPRKDRCNSAKSRLRVESRAILSLRLSVWVGCRRGDRRKASCGHPPGNPEVEVGRALSRDLGQHASGRGPLLARVLAGPEHQFGSVMYRRDHPSVVDREFIGLLQERFWRLARHLEGVENLL